MEIVNYLQFVLMITVGICQTSKLLCKVKADTQVLR